MFQNRDHNLLLNSSTPFSEIFSFSRSFSNYLSFLQILLASCLIGICAQIKIPLYFTPVPLAFTTIAVMLTGAFLGSKKGALATICYLLQGFIGLPVWAGGAAGGFTYFMGPTGGYLIGYIIQAFLVGWLLENQSKLTFTKLTGSLFCASCVQLALGSIWLAQFVGFSNCLLLGACPFILGDLLKTLLVACCFTYKKK